jgi:hypothetical protein
MRCQHGLLPALPLFLTPNNNILLMRHSDLLKKSIQDGREIAQTQAEEYGRICLQKYTAMRCFAVTFSPLI